MCSATQVCQCIIRFSSMQCTWCFGIHLLSLVAGVLYMCKAARSTAPSMQSSGLYKACSDVQSALGNASLPEELARICDGLRINDIVCQGFSYNSSSGRAYFKGQPPNTPFDMQKACNYPDFSLWVLNSGEIRNLSRYAEVLVAFTSGIWPFYADNANKPTQSEASIQGRQHCLLQT